MKEEEWLRVRKQNSRDLRELLVKAGKQQQQNPQISVKKKKEKKDAIIHVSNKQNMNSCLFDF